MVWWVRPATYVGSRLAGHAYAAYHTYKKPYHFARASYKGAAGVAALAYGMKRKFGGSKHGGKRARKYRPRTTARKFGGSAGVLTTQHDARVSKNRKRMSKKKLRKVKFEKKVDAAISESRGLISLIETSLADQTLAVGASPQNYGAIKQLVVPSFGTATVGGFRLGCYGSTGGASGLRKLIEELYDHGREAFRLDTTAPYTSNAAIRKSINETEFYVKSSKANVAFRNLYSLPLYLDIYEVVSRTEIQPSTYQTAQGCWDALMTTVDQSVAVSGSGAKTYVTARPDDSGSTPYTCPEFGKYWKVLKKARVQLPAGGVMNYTFSGYKGKVNYAKDLTPGRIQAEKCKDLLVVMCPTFNPFLAGDVGTDMLEWQVNKQYWVNWKDAPGKTINYAIKYLID